MQDTRYADDGAARILQIMRDTFGGYFKGYHDGEPEAMTDDDFPALMVVSPRIDVQMGATGTDDITERVTIIVALNKMDDVGATNGDDLTAFKIRKLVIGQDPASTPGAIASYLPDTIMYALRSNITLNSGASNNSVSVEFDINQRGANVYTQEAYITVTIDRYAQVPSRT